MAVKSRVYIRNTLGQFASVTRGRKASKSLSKRKGRGGRRTNSVAGGGTIGGVPAGKAAQRIRQKVADEAVEGDKLRKGR